MCVIVTVPRGNTSKCCKAVTSATILLLSTWRMSDAAPGLNDAVSASSDARAGENRVSAEGVAGSAGTNASTCDKQQDGPDISNPTLSQTLASHHIGVFEVPLEKIVVTALVRQLNDKGLDTVSDSVKKNGWMPSSAPSVVVSRELCPNGEWSAECISTASFKVLDGNHRITAAKRLFGRETRVAVRVYYEFKPKDMRVLGDGECSVYYSMLCCF